MKIPESIIEKLFLVESDAQAGNSLINNLVVYKSTILHFDGYYFMECNLKGEPNPYIGVFNKELKRYCDITPELIKAMDVMDLIKLVYKLVGEPQKAAFKTY